MKYEWANWIQALGIGTSINEKTVESQFAIFWSCIFFFHFIGIVSPWNLVRAALGKDANRYDLRDAVLGFFSEKYEGISRELVGEEDDATFFFFLLKILVSKNIKMDILGTAVELVQDMDCKRNLRNDRKNE